jgi:hypothetical protein
MQTLWQDLRYGARGTRAWQTISNSSCGSCTPAKR